MRSKWVALLMLFAAISIDAQEYKLALPGYKFEFPRDYFNHEEYQTEWWYYTGNLRAKDGHRFGFELTFFRQGVSRASNNDPWFVRDLWMAHLALSDVAGQRFYHEERLNRAGPGIAGVDEKTGLVWNGNWQARIGEREEDLSGVAARFGLGLKLLAAKAPVIHGQNGVSQKAEGAGHASHYFSLTRLLTTGSIDVEGKTYVVDGTSWMDHEFFTGSMVADETGWDWLSVQLDDGSELMLYRLRHRDGSIDPYSSGSYVDAQGKSEFLAAKDFVMTPVGDNWSSPATKASYPLRWHVSAAKLQLEFDVTTPLRDQELVSTYGPSYWEGTVDIQGTRRGATLRGVGYLEMTGYARPGEAVIPR
jgi:predicted secreted hydrolase